MKLTNTMKKVKVVVTQSHCRDIETKLELIHLPIIEFEKLEYDSNLLDKHYDWVVITSKNTVRFFLEELKKIQFDHIASIGKTTSEALINEGFKVDFEPSDYTQEGFKKEFHVNTGDRVLYPASKNKRSIMKDYFVERGARLSELILYEPIVNLDTIHILNKTLSEIDYITFSSPSGVHAFMKYFSRNNLKNIKVIAIGHVTKKALTEHNIESLIPAQATLDSMIETIEKEFPNEFR